MERGSASWLSAVPWIYPVFISISNFQNSLENHFKLSLVLKNYMERYLEIKKHYICNFQIIQKNYMLTHAYMSTQVLVSKHENEQCVSNALTCTPLCYSSNFSLGLIISKMNNFILQFYSLTIAFYFVSISAASLTPGYSLVGHLVPLSDAHTPFSSGLKCSVSHSLHKRKHFYLSRQL